MSYAGESPFRGANLHSFRNLQTVSYVIVFSVALSSSI